VLEFVPSRLRWRLRAAADRELSRDQRRELGEACLRIAPGWSDRAIASMVGLSPTTIGKLRRIESGHPSQAGIRMVEPNEGSDGGGLIHTCGMATIELERESVAQVVRPLRRAPRRQPDGMAAAVFAATPDLPESHFIGWASEVDVDALFEAGEIYGVTIRRIACGRPSTGCEARTVGPASATPRRADSLQRFGGEA
jgi:hypothetical protein